jgi:hypothetical protein
LRSGGRLENGRRFFARPVPRKILGAKRRFKIQMQQPRLAQVFLKEFNWGYKNEPLSGAVVKFVLIALIYHTATPLPKSTKSIRLLHLKLEPAF